MNQFIAPPTNFHLRQTCEFLSRVDVTYADVATFSFFFFSRLCLVRSSRSFSSKMAESNADATTPAQASSLRKGGHIVIKGHPCKVVEMSTSKTGKHGHAKVHFVAVDIFTGKKLEDLCPSTHNVQVPKIQRSDLGLIDINDEGYCSCLLDNGETKDDLKIPEGELGDKIRNAFDEGKEVNVAVVAAMGHEQIQSFKIQN